MARFLPALFFSTCVLLAVCVAGMLSGCGGASPADKAGKEKLPATPSAPANPQQSSGGGDLALAQKPQTPKETVLAPSRLEGIIKSELLQKIREGSKATLYLLEEEPQSVELADAYHKAAWGWLAAMRKCLSLKQEGDRLGDSAKQLDDPRQKLAALKESFEKLDEAKVWGQTRAVKWALEQNAARQELLRYAEQRHAPTCALGPDGKFQFSDPDQRKKYLVLFNVFPQNGGWIVPVSMEKSPLQLTDDDAVAATEASARKQHFDPDTEFAAQPATRPMVLEYITFDDAALPQGWKVRAGGPIKAVPGNGKLLFTGTQNSSQGGKIECLKDLKADEFVRLEADVELAPASPVHFGLRLASGSATALEIELGKDESGEVKFRFRDFSGPSPAWSSIQTPWPPEGRVRLGLDTEDLKLGHINMWVNGKKRAEVNLKFQKPTKITAGFFVQAPPEQTVDVTVTNVALLVRGTPKEDEGPNPLIILHPDDKQPLPTRISPAPKAVVPAAVACPRCEGRGKTMTTNTHVSGTPGASLRSGGIPMDIETEKWDNNARNPKIKVCPICNGTGRLETGDAIVAAETWLKQQEQKQQEWLRIDISQSDVFRQQARAKLTQLRDTQAAIQAQCQRNLKLAKDGQRDAQYAVGTYYMSGAEVPKDGKEAVIWFRKAAEQGQPSAQMALALALTAGNATDKETDEAAKWAQKAADQKVVGAADLLAKILIAQEARAQKLLTAGQFYLQNHEKDLAKEQFQQITQKYPKTSQAKIASDELEKLGVSAGKSVPPGKGE